MRPVSSEAGRIRFPAGARPYAGAMTSTASHALAPRRRRELAELRLVSQGVVDRPFSSPQEVAEHLVCLQGQHGNGVRAAIALRLATPSLAAVAAAYADGSIVRGYPMRSTVFATSAHDLAWMTALTGPRQLRDAAKRRAAHGFTDASVSAAAETAREVLAERGPLTRDALAAALVDAVEVPLDGGRRYHLLFTLMASGDLCYGPLDGAEHLVVDARSWLPAASTLEARFNGDEEAAIAEWLRRYLVGHGPASLREFHWWTKLPLGLVRRAAASVLPELERFGQDAAGEDLYGAPDLRARVSEVGARAIGAARLLPPFDEIVLGYQDRGIIVDEQHQARIVPGNNGVFLPTAHLRGAVVGTWRHVGTGRARRVELEPFAELSPTSRRAFERAAEAYPTG